MTQKEKINQIIAEKGYYSVMNNTKWRELKSGVAKLPFEPPFVDKAIDEDEKPWHKFDEDVSHLSDWGFGNPHLDDYIGSDMYATPFYAVEWIKVRPRYLKTWPHRLIPDPREIAQDATEQFIEILQKHSIPYEEDNGAFIIYGYRK